MVQRLAVLILVLAVASAEAPAQAHPGGLARQLSMGGSLFGSNLVLNPYVFEDPVYILVNPAYQANYPQYAYLNVAGGRLSGFSTADNAFGSQFVGVSFAPSRRFTIGAILSRDPSVANQVASQMSTFISAAQGAGRPQAAPPPIDVFEVTGTFDLGLMDVGVGVITGWSSRTSTSEGPPQASSKSEVSANMFGARAGILMNLGGGNILDAAAQFRLDKANDDITGTDIAGAASNNGEYSASATEIGAWARLKLRASKTVNFIPFGAFQSVSGEPSQDAPPTGGTAYQGSVSFSAQSFALGIGGEYTSSTIYLAGGVSWQSSKQTTETTPPPPTGTTTSSTTVSSVPVFHFGGEWWFLDWLGARAGYYRAFATTTNRNEPPTGGVITETSVFGGTSLVPIGSYAFTDNSLITLGLGLQFGGFALDAMVSEDALRRGLGLVGSSDNLNTFGYITLSYGFE
jgi:hypothetical protein